MTEADLELRLSEPSQADIEAARSVEGDILIIGAAGKMGPSLTHLIRRSLDAAGNPARLYTASRSPLELPGVTHIQADLLAPSGLGKLPAAPNVFFLAAHKFGATSEPWRTWATNVLLPGLTGAHFRSSRIVAFSTGNVYALSIPASGGPAESTPPDPVGEYAWTALGRERMFEHASSTYGTPVTILRLNYAVDLRYGVLVDIAVKVRESIPIDLSMGHVNVVWQGYANSVCFRSLAHAASPPFILNLTGQETLSVREIALRFGEIFNREPVFTGAEQETALLNDASACHRLFGVPSPCAAELIEMVAGWIRSGGRLLNKPTSFQVRDGRF